MIDHRVVHALHVEQLRSSDMGADLDEHHAVFQTSTLSALLDGAYDGDVSVAELAVRGDTGLGTLDALDGELIALDGAFYQASVDGSVREVDPAERTPFAVVVLFQPDVRVALEGPLSHHELLEHLDTLIPDDALCYAVRVDGRFASVRARSVPRQERPYRPLAEVVADQREFDLPELSGSLVGFRFPDYAQGLNVPGYHLHVISADRSAGGHLLDCRLLEGEARLDHSSDLHMELPAGVAVADPDSSAAGRGEIDRIEGETS
jgi:acetolactate decarboxylase